MQPQSPRTFGTQKQILFDDALVDDKRGFTLTMNPALRTESPVVVADKPWETGGVHLASIVSGEKSEHDEAGFFCSHQPSPTQRRRSPIVRLRSCKSWLSVNNREERHGKATRNVLPRRTSPSDLHVRTAHAEGGV